MRRTPGVFLLIWLLLVSATPVWGDFYVVAVGGGVGTKITSAPYTINEPGFYYLGKNLNSTGDGITVNSSNVTIDLMGFSIMGADRTVSGSVGIKLFNEVKNVEIRNGTIRQFDLGIYMDTMQSNVNAIRIINTRIINNNNGIYIRGDNQLIKGCTVDDSALSGINAIGSGTISNNMVNYAAGGWGISTSGVWNVTGNTISNGHICLAFFAAGNIIDNTISCGTGQYGLWLTTDVDQQVLVSRNVVTGAGTHINPGHSKIFYVGNVGLTNNNTNSFLAP
jgi:hypothetical protein